MPHHSNGESAKSEISQDVHNTIEDENWSAIRALLQAGCEPRLRERTLEDGCEEARDSPDENDTPEDHVGHVELSGAVDLLDEQAERYFGAAIDTDGEDT